MAIELQQPQMVICKRCSTEAPEGSKFCPACGKRLPKLKPEPEPVDQYIIKQVEPVLTVKGVCDFLQISECKLYALLRGKMIPYFTVGEHKRFLTCDLIEWARDQQINL